MLAQRWEDKQLIPCISLHFNACLLKPARAPSVFVLHTQTAINLLMARNVRSHCSCYTRCLVHLILFFSSSQCCLQEARGPSLGRVPMIAWPRTTAARRMKSGFLRSVFPAVSFRHWEWSTSCIMRFVWVTWVVRSINSCFWVISLQKSSLLAYKGSH